MTETTEQFFDEVPGIIWEMEPRGDEWYFTRRYGEYKPENRRDVIGKSLFEILPKGHPVVQTILRGVALKTYFTFIERVFAKTGEIAFQSTNFFLSINISVEYLLNSDVFEAISAAIIQNRFPASSLHIEILELPDKIYME